MSLLRDPTVKRVALVRLRVGLGDLLCSLPAARALKRFRPDVEVWMITWAEMEPVVARMGGYLDRLLPFPGVAGIPEREPDPVGWPAFLDQARAAHFDVAVQCYGDNPRANEVAGAIGARHVAGFAPDGWAPTRDRQLLVPYPTDRHEVLRHLEVMRVLGVPVTDGDTDLEFPVTPEENLQLGDLLRSHQLAPGGYAVLHPGASAVSRRWPTQRYAALADELAADGLRIVLTGDAAERRVTARVADAMVAAPVDLAGATPLGVLAALIRESAVLVGNDTGTAHLAAAVGAPSVTLFLPGDPIRWAHQAEQHRTVWVDVGCNPCPHLRCPIDHPCAAAITPQHVLEEVHRARRR